MLASWISLTRIRDFYHHPVDVFCGAFTGIAVAFYYKGDKNLSATRDPEEEDHHHEETTANTENFTLHS